MKNQHILEKWRGPAYRDAEGQSHEDTLTKMQRVEVTRTALPRCGGSKCKGKCLPRCGGLKWRGRPYQDEEGRSDEDMLGDLEGQSHEDMLTEVRRVKVKKTRLPRCGGSKSWGRAYQDAEGWIDKIEVKDMEEEEEEENKKIKSTVRDFFKGFLWGTSWPHTMPWWLKNILKLCICVPPLREEWSEVVGS